jgi:hypothetical protein
MTAYNKRFQPWEIWGLPAAGLFGLVGGLLGGLMAFLLPAPLNVLCGVAGVIALILGIVGFVLGDEFSWLFQKVWHVLEQRRPSQFGPDA